MDTNKKRGQFVLAGSSNFLLQDHISQSLSGRMGFLQLLPLSFGELKNANLDSPDVDKHLFYGGYPEIWEQGISPQKWYDAYIRTYVERDVRLLRNITNLGSFTRFLMICANYAGQLVNRNEISRKIGVDTKTIQAWIDVLESSFVLFLLQTWYKNLNKRIIKAPKLYFYDTGLLCRLLGINSQQALRKHPLYGSIFENWMLTEIKKNRFNAGINDPLYFFRDSAGNEVDLIFEKGGTIMALEIKSGKTINPSMLSGLKFWLKHNQDPNKQGILIYQGKEKTITGNPPIQILNWKAVADL